MKIGVITYGLDRPLTGIGRYTVELLRALRKAEEAPEIVLLTAGDPGPLADKGYHSVSMPTCSRLPGLITLGNIWVSRRARQLKLDVIHDPTGTAPFLFGPGIARVVTLYDVLPWVTPENSALLERIIYRYWLPSRLPRLQAVITISRHSQRDIQKYLPIRAGQLFAIPCGVSDFFREKVTDGEKIRLGARFGICRPFILYAGAITARKNIAVLVEAFSRLRKDHPGLSLVLAGPRLDPQNNLLATAQGLGLGHSLVCTGPISDSELRTLYASAELFVFPSLYEGFGLPPLEAMACGVPVICSNSSSLPEVVGEAALLVNPKDGRAWTEAMRSVLEDPCLRKELREKGLVQSTKFSWDRTAKETLAVYRYALGATSTRKSEDHQGTRR